MATKKSKRSKHLKRTMTFSVQTIVLFIVAFGAVGAVAIWKSLAAPATTTPASIVLNQTDPYLGSSVTFTATWPKIKGNITPRIAVRCFQDVNNDGTVNTQDANPVTNADLVYAEAGSADQSKQLALTGNPGFLLGGNPDGGSIWRNRGGAATCNAELFYYSYEQGNHQIYNYLTKTSDWAAGAAR